MPSTRGKAGRPDGGPARRMRGAALALGVALAGAWGSGCTEDPGPLFGGDTDVRWPGATLCTEPRPEVCTREYRPVCGALRGGPRRTFANACAACSDGNVVSWTAGRCAEPRPAPGRTPRPPPESPPPAPSDGG